MAQLRSALRPAQQGAPEKPLPTTLAYQDYTPALRLSVSQYLLTLRNSRSIQTTPTARGVLVPLPKSRSTTPAPLRARPSAGATLCLLVTLPKSSPAPRLSNTYIPNTQLPRDRDEASRRPPKPQVRQHKLARRSPREFASVYSEVDNFNRPSSRKLK